MFQITKINIPWATKYQCLIKSCCLGCVKLKDVDLKIIAKDVCDIKTDHQKDKPFSVSYNRSDKGDKIRSSKLSILIKLYNLSHFCYALFATFFSYWNRLSIMAIYSKLHLKVPMGLVKIHVSQSFIHTNLKGSRMHSYRILGEFNTTLTS